jgi:hypothetical protein
MLMVFCAAVALSQEQAPSQSSSQWVLRLDGIGPVYVGMTLAELNRALQEKFTMPTEKDEQGCFFVYFLCPAQAGALHDRGRPRFANRCAYSQCFKR